MPIKLFALMYLGFLIFTILFQVGLILGKPWGEWTMGGYVKGVLPARLRVGASLSVLILGFFGLVTADKALLSAVDFGFPGWVGLLIIGFNVLAVFANSVTRSQKERRLWQPITIAMLVCSLIVFAVL
jgi:hypothetical protein